MAERRTYGRRKIRHPVRKQLIKDIMKMMTEQGPMKSEDMARFMGFHEKAEINPTLYYMRRHRLAQQNRTRSLKWEITENNDAFEKWSAEQGNLDASANSESFESFEEEPMSDDGEDESGSSTFGMTGFQPDPAPLPATQHPSFGRGRGILSLPMQNSLPNTSFARGFNSGSGLSQLSQGSGFTSHVGSVQGVAGAVKQLQPNQTEDVEKKILNAMKTRPLGTATVGALSGMLGMAQDRIVQVLQTKEKLGTVSLVNKQQNLWVLTTKGEAELSGLPIGPAGNGSSGSRPLAPHLFMSANPKFGPASGSLSAENMDTEAANEKSGSVSVACVQMKSEPIESSVISQATSSNIPRPPHMVEFDRTGKVPEAYMQSDFASSDNSFGRQSGATSSNPNQGFSSMNSQMQGLSSESFAVLNKNPISALMEFAQSRKQTATIEVVRMSGPPHRRRFVVAAVIGNRQFPTVEKTSKKDARTEAADIALRTLIAEGAYNMPQKSQTVKINHVPMATSSPAVTHPVAMPTNAGSPALSNESFAALNKNPVSALMEYAQQRQQKARIELLSQSGPPHSPSFVMAAYVGDRQFATVSRSSKKEGKTEAAEVALRTLIGEGAYRNNTSKQDPGTPLDPNSMTHFDKIAAVSHQAFNILATKIPENFAGRKVIAALVLKRGEEDDGTVISVGSGNRCITGQQLSLEGNTVNDSHAEIITRRGFLRYLYQQLLLYEPGQPHDLFEVAPSGKLRIKEGITLHLYISTAPCGDGALFSPRDCENRPATDTDNSVDHHPTFTSNVQGLLRTKMEGGEGTIPIEPEFQGQTFDGIQRGERLRTMSCTDKICRWNVVGLQGALLTHFLEPIYLSSLTLGYLYDHGHLSRAVCCRLGRGDLPSHLPHGYRLNHPWLGRVTMCDPPRETQKTKAFSINWCHGDANPEVLDGTQGICYTSLENKLFSRVRKRALYDHFKEVAKKFGRSDLLELENYNQGKKLATDFQAAKQAMLKEFSTLKCGPWVGKPIEEEMFS